MNCGNCGQEFVGERWQKVCKPCFIKSKNSLQGEQGKPADKDKIIVRQVLYKCASELLDKGTPADKVNGFVKELERGFYE